jgi:hypothetical protein
MPAVLFREGYDVDDVLAELDREHPDGVHVVDIRYDREGGVGGFFARRKVGVSYTAVEPSETGTSAEDGPVDPSGETPIAANTEFARMLLELAAEKAAARREEEEPMTDLPEPHSFEPGFNGSTANGHRVAGAITLLDTLNGSVNGSRPKHLRVTDEPAPAAPPVNGWTAPPPRAAEAAPAAPRHAEPAPVAAYPEPTPAVEATPLADGLVRAGVHSALRDLGIPAEWIPADVADPLTGVRRALSRVRTATPPTGSGFVIVVAGPADLAVAAARQVHDRLRISRPLLAVGCRPDGLADDQIIRDTRHASVVGADVRWGNGGPAVVAVAVAEPGSAWSRAADELGRIVERLAPEAVWCVADARWKPADVRALGKLLPRTDALAVVNAERTVSPAALWELNLPFALLDGRPATSAEWTALLLDRLEPQL